MFAVEPHMNKLATRTTADGVTVTFSDSGEMLIQADRLTDRVIARSIPRSLVFVIADEVCITDAASLRNLVKAARKADNSVFERFSSDHSDAFKLSEIRRLTRAFQ
jgi:hypothetical protein